MSNKSSYPCPNCQIGQCQPEQGTYVRLRGAVLISVPEMPMWTCDICGYHEFERESVSQLEAMIGELNEQPNPARSSTKMPPVDAPDHNAVRRVKS